MGKAKPKPTMFNDSHPSIHYGKGPWKPQGSKKVRYPQEGTPTREGHPNVGYIFGKHD